MSLQTIRERRHAVEAVRDVVSAMRATAAGRIQAAQRAMAAARQYRDVVVRGLAAAGPPMMVTASRSCQGPAMLIVLTSEQPLCGAFNHTVIDRAIAVYRERSRDAKIEVVAVGQRGSRVIASRGLPIGYVERGTTSLAGLRDLVRRLAIHADHGYASGALDSVDVVYARYQSVSEQVATVDRVLPIDPAIFPPAPASTNFYRYLPDPQLVAGLVGQFAYISLYHAAAESYASEQASRLVAMDGATRNTSRMVNDLIGQERRERQQDITRQMLELTASRLAADAAEPLGL